jgi:hypothetical protein
VSDQEVSLTPAELAFFRALDDLGVPYLVVGMSAALLQGAPVVTQDIDVWLGNQAPWDLVREAARRAGGFYAAGVGLQQPTLGGSGLDRLDLVMSASGLGPFEDEYRQARRYEVEGIQLPVLPLERIIVSKRAAGREKDRIVMAALEAALRAQQSRERGRGC